MYLRATYTEKWPDGRPDAFEALYDGGSGSWYGWDSFSGGGAFF